MFGHVNKALECTLSWALKCLWWVSQRAEWGYGMWHVSCLNEVTDHLMHECMRVALLKGSKLT